MVIQGSSDKDRIEKQFHAERLCSFLKQGFYLAIGAANLPEISPEEFLTGGIGECEITYPETFSWDPPNHPDQFLDFENLTLRWARNNEGEIALLKVVSGGKKAKKLFGTHTKEWQECGSKFEGLDPFPCQLFLRACYKMFILKREASVA